MKSWPEQDAKDRFGERGPRIVTNRGVETAVLVPFTEWRRLAGDPRPNLKDLLLSDEARCDELVPPPRRGARHRAPPKF